MTPDAPLRPGSQVTFDSLFDLAMRASVAYKKTYAHALDLGINPKDIVLYATGALSPGERDRFHGQLLQSPWALGRVVAIVKAKRGGLVCLALVSITDEEDCEILDRL
jgi:hypothetical protein